MVLTPRQIHAIADRLNQIATDAQRDHWTPAGAQGAVHAALEQLMPAESVDDAEHAFVALRVCYEAEFVR
ncbi:hypothetical protein [Jiangella alkaliphila]|uniref:Uncharacterized protein n=1 Tax=Jiangella alkaliphila TaxID=419479 RepID=A0A1H2L809_9ACTN|nr:hypothetical protein [Jiangella alkaliphila]SDU77069.1 hypothetical protein SAMN04488563_5409 [Jiangella alkaliphila]